MRTSDVLLENDLRDVLESRTRQSSAGFPYLHRSVWARLRDWVPLLLKDGQGVLDTTHRLAAEIGESCADNTRVIRQVVRTAAITAPSDLWLMRHVQSALATTGLAGRLLAGETLHPNDTGFLAAEIEIDLRFLLSRGTLVRQGVGYRLADHRAVSAFMALPPTTTRPDASKAWIAALQSNKDVEERRASLARQPLGDDNRERGIWHPTAAQIELAAQLVPLVVALKAKGPLDAIVDMRAFDSVFEDPGINEIARSILEDAGVLRGVKVTPLGRRVLSRGPGPMGIIEAYNQYLLKLPDIWKKGRGEVWVERRANVAASQTANHRSFTRAHDALDAFCRDTGFQYDVFIEHAVGKGEAIRQRAERDGQAQKRRFVGADLEDSAVDAAELERDEGHLPANTAFVRRADIGAPETLLSGLAKLGIDPKGAVMMVGNGFHEVRDKTDDEMIAVFAAYERAGLVLIFTEESALSVDDLLETAFNTYHAGFRYVHERSGQRLRPGFKTAESALEDDLPMSWSECASRAGYVRAERYCQRSRTVYPYTPPSGFNPSISAEHFFVPRRIMEQTQR